MKKIVPIQYKNILQCWHRLEHFSPSTVPNSSNNNVEILEEIIPWEVPLRPKDSNKTIEYTIYLGVFDLYVVDEFVNKYFNDINKDENFRNSKICYASLKLDINGKYISESFGISTLPWALGQLEKENLKNDKWNLVFENIKKSLINYIELNFKKTITDKENKIIKTSKVIDKGQLKKLQEQVIILSDWSIQPRQEIYIKRIEKFKPKENTENKPTSDLLNSFYINDLEAMIRLCENDTLPKSFQKYLAGNLNIETKKSDLRKDVEIIKSSLNPINFPDGSWPSEFKLNLMQQYAVNILYQNNNENLTSVNGPPGTGKTTLLRDIIAPIIVDRAKELSKIINPSDAFKRVGVLKINDKYSPWIYEPIGSISKTGIVIASSNNGAVENISKELPLKNGISDEFKNKIGYFKSVSEKCYGESNWGLISAVLGNKKNRSKLINDLWFNSEHEDLRDTLKRNAKLDNVEWVELKKKFKQKLKEVNDEKKRLSRMCTDYTNYSKLVVKYKEVESELKIVQNDLEVMKAKYDNLILELESLNQKKKEALKELDTINNSKPNFLIYIFSGRKRRAYKKALDFALVNYSSIERLRKQNENKLPQLKSNLTLLQTLHESKLQVSYEMNNRIKQFKPKIDKDKEELKNNYADDKYWKDINLKSSQEFCPWYSDKLKNLQSELFVISLSLNETFILTANTRSYKVSTTLACFFEYLKGESESSAREIKAMWNTFFLVFPVISSTFASVQTMFNGLGEGELQWLFIDEAGQATPQSAAGLIWRSKKVGIVGDPHQIEPVVTIPGSITNNISKYFNLNNSQIHSEHSVQTMADRVNQFGTYLSLNEKKEWVGIPLRVHRRCINPMFEISNSIAYDNLMYCSTIKPKNIELSYKTEFIHCKGSVEGRHYVTQHAEIIKDIIISEIKIQQKLPNLFVISPFNEISYIFKSFLYRFIFSELKKFSEVESNMVNEWLKEHIGTIHTFQGKQADGVILFLGLDENTKGAANWASKKPNLLNVAITRAKYRFIAVGDKDIWLNQPYFNHLKKLNH